jgi:hypothetical protein
MEYANPIVGSWPLTDAALALGSIFRLVAMRLLTMGEGKSAFK